MYDPIWSAENAADDVDRKFLTPTPCHECGVIIDLPLGDNICNECWSALYDTEEDD